LARLKIGIYLDPVSRDAPPGGAAFCACVLAEHMEKEHDVYLLHHRANFDRDLLNRSFGTQLARSHVCYVEPRPTRATSNWRMPWTRYWAARSMRAELSDGCDLFIAFVHGIPPFCLARIGVLIVLFPTVDPPWASRLRGPKAWLLRCYEAWEWRRRFASYRHRVAISQYAAYWTACRWQVECGTVYPPVDRIANGVAKQDLILSVSRFTPSKKQPEMVAAFRSLASRLAGDWSFACAGGLDESEPSLAYFGRAETESAGAPVQFHLNLSRPELEGLYGRARIFWHAMGYGENPNRPEQMEHFGIVTVEAMSAGCVPVVFDGGGQAEIVRHGVDGFRWTTIEELQQYTARLAADAEMWGAMSRSAKQRAAEFDRAHYLEALNRLTSG
jgi:glycosyltransferase involved in cell wall biosynthesis